MAVSVPPAPRQVQKGRKGSLLVQRPQVPPPYRPWHGTSVQQRVPWATIAYLAGTTALVLWYIREYAFLPERVPQEVIDRWSFRIPDLVHDPGSVPLHLVISVWANYYLLQFLYVSALLDLFASWFERYEGWLRTSLLFYGTSIAAALVAGFALLAADAASDAAWIDQELSRVWVGGSAGAYGLVGGVAARARRAWPWLAGAAVWEAALGLVYLQSYTPAFHLTALAVGFLWTRSGLRPRALGPLGEDRA